MRTRMKKALVIGAASLAAIAGIGTGLAYAAGGSSDYEMKHVHWHFNGPFGTYDRAAMQRGYQVYREVCASCHQLKFLSFRHLGDKGGPYYDEKYPNPNDNPYVKAFAADWLIEDIDTETGDPIERAGIPADRFPAIYPNDAAAAGSNGGAIPPELSVMAKARGGGADYLYNLLISYDEKDPNYNHAFGGEIAMVAPLSDGLVEYADGTEATVDQMAKDVTEFLAWSADPKMEARKQTGLAVMIYLLILGILSYLAYKRVWRDVEH